MIKDTKHDGQTVARYGSPVDQVTYTLSLQSASWPECDWGTQKGTWVGGLAITKNAEKKKGEKPVTFATF